MTPAIYAATFDPHDALTVITDWAAANPVTAWTAGAAVAVVLFALGTYAAVSALRGRSGKAKAAIGYAAVQIGMAYVTVTGGYDFWHLVAHMGAVEAAALSVFIEAAQWFAIGKAFEWMAAHTDDTPHIGYGIAGRYFWAFVAGGSTLAVLGAAVGQHNTALAVGRTVAVVIGSLLWDLLLRERMHRDATIPPTVLLLTWRRLGIRLGMIAAEDKDVQTQSREWTLRRMSRALRWQNEGNRMLKTLGSRYLMRAMDSGDAALLSAAVDRYAMNWLLRNEVTAGHATMAAALAAARRVLTPPAAIPLPPPPKPEVSVPPVRRARAIGAPTNAAELRERAVAWAMTQLRAGVRLTGRQVGEQFDNKEEWGRQRLREAETRLEGQRANGSTPAA